MKCCFRDAELDKCENRRMAELPMCQKHMMLTFRNALVAGALPADVFREISQEAVRLLTAGHYRRDLELDKAIHAHKIERARQEEARRRELEQSSVVYYVALTGGRVKIGWTRDLDSRIAVYRARPEDVLATETGGRSLEAKRHRQFSAERIGRSEDFMLSDRILAHIATLTRQDA